jgi:hypothetical protein
VLTYDNQYERILVSNKDGPGGEFGDIAPRARTTRGVLVIKTRILRQVLRDEARRTILREAEDRYRHELLEDEERQLLLDRIKRLRKALA